MKPRLVRDQSEYTRRVFPTGLEMFVVNQGTVRRARVIAHGRTRVTLAWRNSVRDMTRDVEPVSDVDTWLLAPNSSGLDSRALRDYNPEGLNIKKVKRQLQEAAQ